jgi:8-oxo-dGTP diphosphatase
VTSGPSDRESNQVVRAAGAVLWRHRRGAVEVALVHRPKYDDWSFPKGKLDKGESDRAAARREVEEETACVGLLGAELASTAYVDSKGRPKTVRYWEMELEREDGFVPNEEVDDVRWVGIAEAEAMLSYVHDLDVLESFVASRSFDREARRDG